MDHRPLRTDIIDAAAFAADLEAIAAKHGTNADAARVDLIPLAKTVLSAGNREIKHRFENGTKGLEAAGLRSLLIDEYLRALYDFTTHHLYNAGNPTAAERLAIVAVGGYGRGQLAPYSDIDLLFLSPYKQTPWGEQVVEYLYYLLWDTGLKVGHATRSLDESIRFAKSDITIRTALLEARFVAGDRALFKTLRRRFLRNVVAGSGPDFVEAELQERDERHRQKGDSRYVVEPNVKEGKGGLRDLHTLYWIGKYLYRVDQVSELVGRGVLTPREYHRFVKASDFLWTVRHQLHYLTDRQEERLTFDVQPEMGRLLGYRDHSGARGVERFMKHYYLMAKTVGDLTRIFCAALEEQHRRKPLLRRLSFGFGDREIDGFVEQGGRLNLKHENDFVEDPVKLIRLFHVADREGLDIHPAVLRQITRNLIHVNRRLRANKEANRLFLDVLTSKKDPETALRRMNEAGVLGRFVQDFGRVVAQMQYDMYHVYTVDEHAIRALGILSGIEKGERTEEFPQASELVHNITSRRALYLALFLHDI
ncbi:MAG: [protein-PII] uridylyltransferase, partial [Proteobacteria bacterium]|nr:[protein-PII] uridylyltransferase [Pseudomonadota bacterium]